MHELNVRYKQKQRERINEETSLFLRTVDSPQSGRGLSLSQTL